MAANDKPWWVCCSKHMINIISFNLIKDLISITLPTKAYVIKAMVFTLLMQRSETWTIKKAEHSRIDAFEWWCWRRLLRVLDCKGIKPVIPKGNQPWIFIGRTEAGAEAPILWPPDLKSQLTGKDPDTRKEWGQEKKGMTERMRCLDSIADSVDMDLSKLWEIVKDMESWHAAVPGVQRVGYDLANEQQPRWMPGAHCL